MVTVGDSRALGPAHQSDRAALPQDQQEGWATSISAGHDAVDPPVAAVGTPLSDPSMEEALIEVPTMRR